MPRPSFPLDDHYGGRNCRPDERLFDPAWPNMPRWAAAGVRGGVPEVPTVRELTADCSEDELQAALDAVAAEGGGAVLLAAGHYVLTKPLRIGDGTVLRGFYLDAVKIELRMRDTFPGFGADYRPEVAGIHLNGATGAGLEHLTVVFDESLPRPLDFRHLEAPFEDNPRGADDLFVTSILLDTCTDCWVEACRVTDSGSTTIGVVRSTHCTVRYCEICGGHNRGGGHSYFNVSRSESCLVAGCVMKDIRHLAIQNEEPDRPCRYNVVIGCDLETDINYHNGDSGHNLIEDCRIRIPSWHWWGPFAAGVPGGHQPPGPDNLVFNCNAERLRFGCLTRTRMAERADTVYAINDRFESPLVSERGPAPRGGTLYAVRGNWRD